MAVDDSFTKSLLHMDGSDTSTTFTDEDGRTWTARGNAQIDTAQKKFGTASGLFDGTGDYIDTPDHADFVLGSGDWTFDFWLRYNSVAANPCFFEQAADSNNYFNLYSAPGDDEVYCRHVSGGVVQWYFTFPFTESLNTWYHVAIARNGNTPLAFIDGTAASVTEVTSISGKSGADIAGLFKVGYSSVNSQLLNGWLEEFRYSKGIARWTANFTPPTTAYSPTAGNFLVFL